MVRPVLRWAGGKSKLLPKIIPLLPDQWRTYHELMVGGGALFFSLKPTKSNLSDINADLINYYTVLRDDAESLFTRLAKLKASKEQYYSMRSTTPSTALDKAIRFAYLNRLCWNGLYRVNQSGEFNVPFGSRVPKQMWNENQLIGASKDLQQATLHCADFERSLHHIKKGDFVFIDPPYPRGSSSGSGFNRFSPSRFDLADHERLSDFANELTNRGAKVMIVLAGLERIQSIYPISYSKTFIFQRSPLSCHGSTRRKVREVVLRNYA